MESLNEDGMLEKKKKMLDKLESREKDRSTDIEVNRTRAATESVKEEKTEFFEANFLKEVGNIQNMLKCDGVSGKDNLTSHFNLISESFEKLRKFLNDSTLFLKAFELQKAQNTLIDVQLKISARKDELIPRKKFAFKSKKAVPSITAKPNKAEVPKQNKFSANDLTLSDCDIRDKNGENVVLKNDEINQKDIALANIENCRIELHGYPGTVHITNANNCVILCGPVSGSVFVDRCTGTKLSAGCQQLRVHNTKLVDFYLHVTSRAIIEDTTQVRFAPSTWTYDNMVDDFSKAGFKQSKNNWDQVDDFNWLAMDTHSPNWSILPENERISNWKELK